MFHFLSVVMNLKGWTAMPQNNRLTEIKADMMLTLIGFKQISSLSKLVFTVYQNEQERSDCLGRKIHGKINILLLYTLENGQKKCEAHDLQ